jgi:hypothetical protein
MSEQNPNLMTPDDAAQEPFIPPRYLLILAALGFLVAVGVLLTQPTFTVIGFGGLAFGILALIAWVLMAPKEAGDLLSGRSLRYGGSSVLISILLIVALAVVYLLLRTADIRTDLTQSDEFSLTAESREVMESLAADPTVPNIRLLAFYDPSQAGQQDADRLLLQEYSEASGGKVSFEFVNPNQRPDLIGTYNITQLGSLAVTLVNPDGSLNSENSETVGSLTQSALTNAILQVAAQGDFVAYFLRAENTLNDQMSLIKQTLTTQLDWTVRDISLLELTSPEGEFRINDETRDGQVLVLPGGTGTFTPEELQILTDYVNGGGDLIIFAETSLLADGETPLATDAGLNEYLTTNFGIRVNSDVVVDQTQSFQSPLIPVATTFDSANYIVNALPDPNNTIALLTTTNSLTINDELPANVTVSRLIQTSSDSYVKSDIAAILAAQDSSDAFTAAIAKTDTDPAGPVVVAAAAENAQTGARVIVFGSTFGTDDFASSQISNVDIAFNSLIWATNFNDFFQTINVPQPQDPTQTPIVASDGKLREISFWTQWALPFGLLGIGALVLYFNRERRTV